uniref:Putative secreted protein n=1 Tax=Amblyomma americanum TaxID=6943 RepID=B5M7C0_AMBAM
MQLLTIFSLLCLLGPTLSTRTRVQDRRCRWRPKSATGMCHNGEVPKLRFAYNPSTGKCDHFRDLSCGRQILNSFENFTECMTACNPNSPCLKTPTNHKGWIPWKTSFVFDINTLNCTEKKSFRTPQTGPDYNRFFEMGACKKTCEPDLEQIITSSG